VAGDLPKGQDNDFSGRVVEIGEGVTSFTTGDEVMAFKPRCGQADFVSVDVQQPVTPARQRHHGEASHRTSGGGSKFGMLSDHPGSGRTDALHVDLPVKVDLEGGLDRHERGQVRGGEPSDVVDDP
jgi:NADPH:quinone reductase-like Zn-dependent oxidoreductase